MEMYLNLAVMAIVLIVAPFLLLYAIIKCSLTKNAKQWIEAQSRLKKWHIIFLSISSLSLLLFGIPFGLYLFQIATNNSDIDNSGMGLMLLVPLINMACIFFVTSIISWYLVIVKRKTIDASVFVIMGLLTVPTTLLGVFGALWLFALCFILFK